MENAFTTLNPFSELSIANHVFLSNDDIDFIIEKSHLRFDKWKNQDFNFKKKILKNLSYDLLINIDEYSRMITNEMGKPLKESRGEIKKCSQLCNFYFEHSENFLKPYEVKLEKQVAKISYSPLGIILGIMPWNFPFWQVFRFAIPALMSGNTVIIKHSPNTFGCGDLISFIFNKVGYPKYCYNNIKIHHSQVERIIASDKVQGVSLTGSEKAGAAVGSLAGKYIKKTLFELGGSDPFIIYDDANIELAVSDAISAKFLNSGQSCISPKRFFIHEKIYKIFIKMFIAKLKKLNIGNPMEIETDIGPLAKKEFVDKIKYQVKKSIDMGAEIIFKKDYDSKKGFFIEPIILRHNNLNSPIFNEEVFGPVIPIFIFNDNDNIIELVNFTAYGLGASLWTSCNLKKNNFEQNINTGLLFINGMTKSDPRIPFGGIKKSGYGRELSKEGIKEFVNIKTIVSKDKEF